MSVDLTGLPIRRAVPTPIMFGRTTASDQGGSTDYDDRLGNRWAMEIETPPMRLEPSGRLYIEDLWEAQRQGGVFDIPQPGLSIPPMGTPTVAADTLTGRSVPLAGLEPNVGIKKGQWVSIIHAGRRYADRIRQAVIANADGEATISLRFLLRESLTEGDVVELNSPKMEGFVEGELPLDLSVDWITSFSFRVVEKK